MPNFLRKKPRTVRDVLENMDVPADIIDEAERAGTAELLAIDAVVLPERGKLSIDELAAKVGVDVDAVRGLWRALGFVDVVEGDRPFTKRDVSILKSLIALTSDGLTDPDLTVQMARVIGQSMAQVATAVVDAGEARAGGYGNEETVENTPDRSGGLALRAEELLPFISDVIDYAFRRHLRAAARRRVAVASVEGAGEVIGFADLVRFTELSLRLDDHELAGMVKRFYEIANSVVLDHDGRIVKMIGDAAMFTVVDPVDAAMIALELSDAVATDDQLPGLRVGMAGGPVLAHDGDLYGSVVNLASRLGELGRNGAINISQDVRDAIAGDRRFRTRSLGQRSLRHIGEVRVYRLRPGSEWRLDSPPSEIEAG